MSTTSVRLSGVGRHCKGRPDGGGAPAPARSFAGRWIEVLLPPEAPDGSWTCGTEYVWRVTDSSARELGCADPYGRVVCVHQIEID